MSSMVSKLKSLNSTCVHYFFQESLLPTQTGSGHPILDESIIQTITQQVIESLKSSYTLVPTVPESSQIGEGLNTINSDILNSLPGQNEIINVPLPVTPIVIHKSREHDQFDHSAIVKKLPKLYQDRALKLLEVFDNHESQLTFNESGTLFINGAAVSGSNFFQMLPHLFGSRPKRVLPGFNQLVTQISSMGYGKLINGSLLRGLHRTNLIPNSPELMKEIQKKSNWYYLGE